MDVLKTSLSMNPDAQPQRGAELNARIRDMSQLRKQQNMRFEALKADMESNWKPMLQDISEFIAPYSDRWPEDVDSSVQNNGRSSSVTRDGKRKGKRIIDRTGTKALETLSSGFTSGATSPARPWFSMTLFDRELAQSQRVRAWLDEITKIISNTLLRSNFYRCIPVIYRHLGAYGTAALDVVEDDEDLVRFHALPIGTFYAATNKRGLVDEVCRCQIMTVKQLVDEYGMDNLPASIRQEAETNRLERRHEVRMSIHPNPEYTPGALGATGFRYRSCHWLANNNETDSMLRVWGYHEFKTLVARWESTDRDAYGTGPGWHALGDIQELQHTRKNRSRAVDMETNPPIKIPSNLGDVRVKSFPGGQTYYNPRQDGEGIGRLFDFKFDYQYAQASIEDLRMQVRSTFFEDLFLMLQHVDRNEITATEIMKRQEEKMMALGPVLESLNDDLLDPLIDRVYSILDRRGYLPPPPEELNGVVTVPEYTSIMAQAQRLVGLANTDRFVSTVGAARELDPEIMDWVNLDELPGHYHEKLSVDAKLLNDEEAVLRKRQMRQQQRQQMEQMEAMKATSEAVRNVGAAKVQPDTALGQMLDMAGEPRL